MPLNIKETFPLTHEQAVTTLLDAKWTPEERKQLAGVSLNALQRAAAKALTEYWWLGERTSPLSLHYQRRFGLGHHDDMTHLILRDFLSKAQEDSFSLQDEVAWLKKHWTDQGVNPLTLERIH